MVRMQVLVTGGAGALGSLVVAELRGRGHQASPASRRSGVDLATGEGLAAAVRDVDAVVHCATNPFRARAVDVEGTRKLAQALAGRQDPPHLVAISIVGCDRNPYPYYRAKTAAERIIAQSGLPATVVRATQFHSLAALIGRSLTLGPLALSLGEMAVQPVETRWVAQRLADLVTGAAPDAPRRTTDLAGPQLLTMAEVATALRAHAGQEPPRVVRVPPLGGTLRAFSARTNLPGPDVETGGLSFAEWLSAQPNPPRKH
jgi:uncharacterized protein YbjT (DUF2867 family)